MIPVESPRSPAAVVRQFASGARWLRPLLHTEIHIAQRLVHRRRGRWVTPEVQGLARHGATRKVSAGGSRGIFTVPLWEFDEKWMNETGLQLLRPGRPLTNVDTAPPGSLGCVRLDNATRRQPDRWAHAPSSARLTNRKRPRLQPGSFRYPETGRRLKCRPATLHPRFLVRGV